MKIFITKVAAMIMTIATTKIIWTIIKTILMEIIIKMIITTTTIIKIVTDKADIKIVAKVSGKITIIENKIITEENVVYLTFLGFAVGKKMVVWKMTTYT